MKKMIVIFILSVLFASPVFAAGPFYEAITVSSTAIRFTATVVNNPPVFIAQQAFCTLETNAIRYRIDGVAPTAAEGHLLDPAKITQIVITRSRDIQNFHAIATGANATLRCTYE